MIQEIINDIVVNKSWHSDTKREYIKGMQDNYPKGERIVKYKLNKKTLIFERITQNIDYMI